MKIIIFFFCFALTFAQDKLFTPSTRNTCIGPGCFDNESDCEDTFILKDSDIKITFEDTSTQVGYPSNNWQIHINDKEITGEDNFKIKDLTAATTPFKIEAGAPDGSFIINSDGSTTLYAPIPYQEKTLTVSRSKTSSSLTALATMFLDDLPLGTYLVTFSAYIKHNEAGSQNEYVLVVDGVEIDHSSRFLNIPVIDTRVSIHTQAIITISSATSELELWASTSSGTLTFFRGSLSAILLS